jgi:hypothetical protein
MGTCTSALIQPIDLKELSKDALQLATEFRKVAEDVDNHCNNRGLLTSSGVPLDLEDIFGDFFEGEEYNQLYRRWEDFRSKVPKCFDINALTEREICSQIMGLLSTVNVDSVEDAKMKDHVEYVQRYLAANVSSGDDGISLPARLNVVGFAFSFKDLVEMVVDIVKERSLAAGTVLRTVASSLDSIAIVMLPAPFDVPDVKERKKSKAGAARAWA